MCSCVANFDNHELKVQRVCSSAMIFVVCGCFIVLFLSIFLHFSFLHVDKYLVIFSADLAVQYYPFSE